MTEHERRMRFARERVALAWCHGRNSKTEMDVNLAESFAEILVEEMYAHHLGCATTGEILEELKARSDLSYSTIGVGDAKGQGERG